MKVTLQANDLESVKKTLCSPIATLYLFENNIILEEEEGNLAFHIKHYQERLVFDILKRIAFSKRTRITAVVEDGKFEKRYSF